MANSFPPSVDGQSDAAVEGYSETILANS